MKVGLSININVSKIDKSRLFKGEKGTYLDLTTFVDLDNKDQFDQNGLIKQAVKKDENVDLPILGGVKIFWQGESQNNQSSQQDNDARNAAGFSQGQKPDDDMDIPF